MRFKTLRDVLDYCSASPADLRDVVDVLCESERGRKVAAELAEHLRGEWSGLDAFNRGRLMVVVMAGMTSPGAVADIIGEAIAESAS